MQKNIINVFDNVNVARVTSIHSTETWKQMKVAGRFKGRKRGKSSMIGYNEVDDYDEIDKLKLNNDKVDNKKSVQGKKKKEIVFGRGS